ncbi:unnamed protein product [Didymodactylos carnosus]|uniref:CCHC-type domain-containing protein n=1 Tax=Didymodactylos carnosus TaxID=1234261 RepID=A0A8S2TVI4_9BILA|nr:unnamed protein product [Didymodactylos carnosus]CAF4309648.1 unnamed protein product [Didymodactylos carnosus]
MPSSRIDPYSLVIVDVSLDWALNDIYDDLVNKYGDGVVNVKRMHNRDNQPIRSICVEFDSSEQVEHLLENGLIVIWHERKKVKEYYLPMLCFVCGNAGHRSSACPIAQSCNKRQRQYDVGQIAWSNSTLRKENISSSISSPIDSETTSNTSSIIPPTTSISNNSVDRLLMLQASKFENVLNALETRMSSRISTLEKQIGQLTDSRQ